MTYLVIARKWRPQNFSEVVGQPHVVRTLKNAISTGRVHHAYLFTGARGVGKTSVARILAKALNCEHGTSSEPCNECSNCREITQGNSPDVIEIDGASNRKIENARELLEVVRFRPAKSRHKVYIIDEVHALTSFAFDALLKVLEEPPEHVRFIFATTEPHSVPATIMSRCQRFDFRLISSGEMVAHLGKITASESRSVSDGVLYAIAGEAEGSMRDAQSLLDQVLAFSGDGLSDEEVLDVLGIVDRRSIHRLGESILSGDAVSCLETVSDLHQRGIDSRRVCQRLCDYFRNLTLLVLEGRSGRSILSIPPDERERLLSVATGASVETLQLYLQILIKGEEDLRRSSLPRITLEMMLLRLTQVPQLPSIDTLVSGLKQLERKMAGQGPVTPGPSGSGERRVAAESPVDRRQPPSPVEPEGAQIGPAAPNQWSEVREPVEPVSKPDSQDDPASPDPSSGDSASPGNEAHDPARRPDETRDVNRHGQPADSAGEAADVDKNEPSRLPVRRLYVVSPRDGSMEEPPEMEEPPAGHWEASQSMPDEVRVPVSDEDCCLEWSSFLSVLQNKDQILAAKLTGSRLVLEPRGLVLEVLEVYEDSISDPETLGSIKTEAGRFFGREFNPGVRRINLNPGPTGRENRRPRSGKRRLVDEPIVMQAIEILGGELIDVRVEKPPKPGPGRDTRG